MLLTMMKGKIHQAVVTEANLHYEGSISLDPALYTAAGILPNEQVDVLNCTTGARFTTYVIKGGDGQVCVNGAAARLVQKGDVVIVIAYAQMTPEEAISHQPKVVLIEGKNRIKSSS
jgi:aspartate 1-decarboxylase